jgi:L-alanine-DL-glutamate epimerase-like enolase superfamily enzyme
MLEALGKAREAGVLAIPHCFYYGAGLCATAHIVATLGADILLELPFLEWQENLHPFLPVRPVVSLPDTPGLGFGPDDCMLEAWKVDHAVLC